MSESIGVAPTMGIWNSSDHQFERWSRTYDQSILQHLFFGPTHRAVLRRLPTWKKARLLDVGCGTGRFLELVRSYRPRWTLIGIDASEAMLGKARERAKCSQLQLVSGSSDALPFPDSTFDLVTCLHSFHHHSRQEASISEWSRVLADDGMLFVVDGDRDRAWGRILYDGIVTWIEGNVQHRSQRDFSRMLEQEKMTLGPVERLGFFAPMLMLSATRQRRRSWSPLKRAG